MRSGQGRSSNSRSLTILISVILLLPAISILPAGIGLKPLISHETLHTPSYLVRDVESLGDFDQDGYVDLYMTMPMNSSTGNSAGSVYIFWGSEDGFPAFEPYNADLILTGEENFLFGQDIIAWDYGGDNWDDLVIGCPGANNGVGKLLIYESTDINIAARGAVLNTSSAVLEIQGNNTHFFGSHLETGDMTGDNIKDLMVLSMKDDVLVPRFEMFSGGVIPEFGYEIELPPNSVKNNTRTASMDLYGNGRDAFLYSSPDNGEVRIINIDVSFNPYDLPGANATGVVDFQGSMSSTADTWGWGAGDDGWDTSPTHIYDSDTGVDSVRCNQPTGNAGGADRSFGVENQLFIEVGGVLGSSGGRDMSGAYGVSFNLGSGDISGINSALLAFDWEYEDWGFEANERLWIKARLTDSTGDLVWLGQGRDRSPSPDLTNEVFTRAGVGNPGQTLFGRGRFSTDILPLIDGAGEYYFDVGGKISQWTVATEYGGFGIDNITLTFRELSHDIKLITGSGGLGTGLFTLDVNDDGVKDLLIGSPTQGAVRIFYGKDTYWASLPAINQWMNNITIEGSPNAGLGTSISYLDVSPFTLAPSIAISAPAEIVDATSVGMVYVFDLPIPEGTVQVSNAREKNGAPLDFKYYGWRLLSVWDHDEDEYPELLIVSWTWTDKLRTTLADRSPSYPQLWILNPRRHDVISGHIDIVARVFDVDNDTGPEDVRFYRSNDNRSWNPIGDGTPDTVQGDIAIKHWNTTLFPNAGYFLKVSVTDSFGLETSQYTDRVDVLNHAPPVVNLIYPADGTELRWTEDITAKVIIPSAEEFAPPVRFFYSRDNSTWIEWTNSSEPIEGSTSDHIAEFNTEDHTDGPIWFRINATTVYGLGSEDRNIAPAFINNYYSPEGEILKPYPNSTISGNFNVTISTFDLDGDIVEPVKLFIKVPEEETWELLANMTHDTNGTYFFNWDTTTVDNREYDLMVRIGDSTNFEFEATLNASITVHNLYQPSISIISHSSDQTIDGLEEITAQITDRDMNILEKDIRFLYQPQGLEGIWNSMGKVTLLGNTAHVKWQTTDIANGVYSIRVELKDLDNLTALDQVNNIRVKNIYPPVIEPDLPPFNQAVSGVVRLYVNITDDESIPPENIKVEVQVLGLWVDLGNVSRTNPGGTFEPNVPVSYYVDWDTTARDEDGEKIFPDSIGYDLRITVLDSDGEDASYKTPVSYRVMNDQDADDDDDDSTKDLGIPGWVIAAIAIGILLLLMLIFMFFILRGDKKTKEPIPKITMPVKEEPPPPPAEERPSVTIPEGRDGGIYSPPGWESTATEAPSEDLLMFTADSDVSDLGLDLGAPEDEEHLTELRDQMFGEKPSRPPKKAPKPPKKKKAPRVEVPDIEDTIDITLPDGVVPTQFAAEPPREEEPKGEWAETEEWGEEEEEWDDLEEEDWEELEEEGWVEEEEEWEDDDEEEEEEEEIIVTCKCGEDIEIPTEFKGTKFRCPNCGRKGKIPGR